MPSIEVLIGFTAAAVIMNLSPGPSNLYVMARAVAQGARGGLVAAAGLAVGSLVHVFAAVFGLAAVFKYSPLAYTVFKLVGAGYLIYLGVSYWRAGPAAVENAERLPAKSLGTVFRESVIVEATNPKTALFFLALLPQFVDPAAGPVAPQFLLLGLIVTVSAIPCDVLVAVAAARVSQWLIRHEQAQVIQERVSGSILLGLGGYIVAAEAVGDRR